MEVKLPARTARVVDWHDGLKLWVKTLNVWERDEAAEAAEVWAAGQVLGYGDSKSAVYLMLVDRFAAKSEEEQSLFLAESSLLDGTAGRSAAECWPDADGQDNTKLRETWLKEHHRYQHGAALALPVEERVTRCVLEAVRRRERNLQGYRLVCETLLRAVRVAPLPPPPPCPPQAGGPERGFPSGSPRRLWPDVGVVMELADEERDFFWKLYEEMQLPATLVPTSAAVSLL